MRIRPTVILDVEGGELGAREMVSGAAQACAELRGQDYKLLLISVEKHSTQELVIELMGSNTPHPGCEVDVIEARQKLPEKIESPVEAYKALPESSIRIGMGLAKDTPQSVMISPASTGLVLTAAMFTLGRVKGIDRVPIGTPLPSLKGEIFFTDGGSNVDCRATHLYQFALLSHIYVESVKGVKTPSIALLSNGSESYKGNALVKEAFSLIERDKSLNFTGFIEGHTLFKGEADIMVCDGFLGNILLKSAEGIAEVVFDFLKTELKSEWYSAVAAKLLQRQAFQRFSDRLDYAAFGGAPLLGLKGNVVICHGRSTSKAIKNAIMLGLKQARANIAGQVEAYLENHR